MAFAEGRVGVATLIDGTPREIRLEKSGAICVSDAHARYQEAVYRGNCYIIQTAAAGVALAANNAILTAATALPIVGILNPIGSGVIAVVLKAIVGPQATGAGAVNEGIYVYQVAAPNAATTIAGTQPTSLKSLTLGGSKMIGSLNQAYTGNTAAWIQLKPVIGGVSRFAAPTASINVNGVSEEEVAGMIQVPPGCAFGIFTIAAGTTMTSAGAIVWEEIPV